MTAPMVPARLATGRVIDLAAGPADIDFMREVATPLSRIARYGGQTPEGAYSDAEHSVRGADALMAEITVEEEGRLLGRISFARRCAFAFLLHDGHEGFLGDPTRPFQRLMRLGLGPAESAMLKEAIERARARVDAFIYPAAGLPWPLEEAVAARVKDMDDRMCAEEQRVLWRNHPGPEDADLSHCRPVRITDWADPGYVPWSAPRAAAEWIERFNRWRPRQEARSAGRDRGRPEAGQGSNEGATGMETNP